MNDPGRKTMDLAERRAADRQISTKRQEARRDYVRYAEQAADADLEYRRTKARIFLELRAGGKGVEEAKIQAEGDAADAKRTAAIASSLAKASLLRVDEAERDSVSVRDLHQTSERIDGLAA